MPKLKSKSSAKKRFKVTANGLIKVGYGCKQHFLRRRTKTMKRSARGMGVLSVADTKFVKTYVRG
ncbi:MAG: 50S ribosomal protein L35 [Alphaproteobacteria bacterium]|jgi:large subunit ribosomal protein L35|nr:50S ribosomal protein L35 [Alphaproteobacteria bacterium]